MKLYDISAEQIVLADIFLAEAEKDSPILKDDPERTSGILGALEETDFYRDLHQWIFRAMKSLYQNNERITPTNVCQAINLTTGSNFSDSIRQLLQDAEVEAEIEMVKRIMKEGLPSAISRSVGNANDYIPKLKAAAKNRSISTPVKIERGKGGIYPPIFR